MLSNDARHERIGTEGVHLYEFQEQTKLISAIRSQDSGYPWEGGGWEDGTG